MTDNTISHQEVERLKAKRKTWAIVLSIAGAGAVVCAFLPWATVGIFSFSGIDDGNDGVITAAAGIVVAIAGAVGINQAAPTGGPKVLGIIGSIIIGLVGVYDWWNLTSNSGNEFGFEVSVGGGLIGTAFAGVAGLVAALVLPSHTAFIEAKQTGPGGAALPPAGWHSQADGRLRYWNGSTWTDHYANPSAPPSTPHAADEATASDPSQIPLTSDDQ